MKRTTPKSDIVETLTLQDLCRFCQAEETWVVELVEYGVLEPIGSTTGNWRFVGSNIVRAKKARRLKRDLGINTAGIALVLDLLEERDAVLRRLAQHEAI
ncbi:MAG: chaperone modulator CbpM [Sulfitobacter sp.]